MRQAIPGSRLSCVARASVGLTLAVMLAATAPSAQAQTKKAAPAPPDTRPLARYVPKEGLVMLVESTGIDSHEEEWKKTAAYKMLTETTLGTMLEDTAAQFTEHLLKLDANRKLNGADIVAISKHLAQKGFLFAGYDNMKLGDKEVAPGVIVIRGAASREVRAAFSRLMGTISGTAKAQVVKKDGRSVVEVAGSRLGTGTWVWWAEQNDLVIGLSGQEDVGLVAATLEGKRPNAVEHPARAELLKPDGGFTPVAFTFFDPDSVPKANDPGLAKLVNSMKDTLGLGRVDIRWGFQDDALMTVTRLKSPKPRKMALALLDQPTFDRSKLPPLPAKQESFTAISIEPGKALDLLLDLAGTSTAATSIKDGLEDLKTKSKVDLRKDVLDHIGPKMAFYVLPGPASTKSGADASAKEAEGGAAANPLAGMLGGMMGGGGAAALSIPKFTMIAEIDDPVSFGKRLDTLMVAVNKTIRDQMAAAAAAAPEVAAGPGGPGGMRPGGPGMAGAGAVGDGPASGGGAGRGTRRGPVASPEFKPMPGRDNEKIYILNVPSSLAQQVPAGLRPCIRVAGKYLVIATTPDAAKQALDAKAGEWNPPSEVAGAFDALPKDLIALNVDDPRGTQPETLASLPATIQRLVNLIISISQAPPPGANPSAPGGPDMAYGPGAMPGGPGMAGGMAPGRGGSRAGMAAGGPPPGMAAGGPPPGMAGGMPGMAGGRGGSPPGMAGGEAPKEGTLGMLRFNIDAAKLPKAEDLRSKMFPATLAVSSGDQEVTIVMRESFPSINISSSAVTVALLMPAVQAARDAARRAAGAQAGAAPAAPAGAPAAAPAPAGGSDGRGPGGPPGGAPGAPGGAVRPGPRGAGGRPGGR